MHETQPSGAKNKLLRRLPLLRGCEDKGAGRLTFSFFYQSAARYLQGGKEKNSGARSQARLFPHWIIARLSACVLEPHGELFK